MQIVPAILLFVFGVPLTIFGMIALISALILLLPEPIQQARSILENHPWRAIFLGFLNLFGAGILVALLQTLANQVWETQPIANALSFIIGIYLAVGMMVGLCAVILLVSQRLGQLRRPFFTNLRGGGLLLLACITPIVGWFVFTPLLVAASIGSVIALLPKRKPAAPKDETKMEKPPRKGKPAAPPETAG
jgi:hypothetical protein